MSHLKKQPTDHEIDEIVIAQAEDDAAWEEPVYIQKDEPVLISLPPGIASRATFLARLHKVPSLEEWLQIIIEERVDFEEAAFMGVKQAMVVENGD